jgi:hypothetical protein
MQKDGTDVFFLSKEQNKEEVEKEKKETKS